MDPVPGLSATLFPTRHTASCRQTTQLECMYNNVIGIIWASFCRCSVPLAPFPQFRIACSTSRRLFALSAILFGFLASWGLRYLEPKSRNRPWLSLGSFDCGLGLTTYHEFLSSCAATRTPFSVFTFCRTLIVAAIRMDAWMLCPIRTFIPRLPGLYEAYLQEWLNEVPAEQLMVVRSEDYYNNTKYGHWCESFWTFWTTSHAFLSSMAPHTRSVTCLAYCPWDDH